MLSSTHFLVFHLKLLNFPTVFKPAGKLFHSWLPRHLKDLWVRLFSAWNSGPILMFWLTENLVSAQLHVEVAGGSRLEDLVHHGEGVICCKLPDSKPPCLMKCLSTADTNRAFHYCLSCFVHHNLKCIKKFFPTSKPQGDQINQLWKENPISNHFSCLKAGHVTHFFQCI